MDSKFIKKIQGREFVLYEGLLSEAHNQGLRSIETELIWEPTAENGNTAVVHARVTMVDDDDAKEVRESIAKVFTGIGDASPHNVSKNIAPHTIRMAETRAKARALRDAINVGMTAFEELGEPSQGSEDARREIRALKGGAKSGGSPATHKQLESLVQLMEETGVTWERLREKYGFAENSLSGVTATKITNDLKQHKEKKAATK